MGNTIIGFSTWVVLASLLACDNPVALKGDPAPFITTDRAVYSAEVSGWRSPDDRFWRMELSVGLTYSNPSDIPLYISYCQGPNPPGLERRVNGQWEAAYQPPHLMCGGVLRIDPGEEFSYEFRIRGYDPRIDVRPTWVPDDLEGRYRVVWWPVWSESDVTSEVIPLDRRVSNTFKIMGELP